METTKRYPRTLNEAFGPYASQLAPLAERFDPMPKEDRIVVVAGCVAAVALIVMAAVGWL